MTLLFTLECQYATIAGSIARVFIYKLPYHRSTKFNVLTAVLTTRGGVLEDVLGLENTFSSPWPGPRSLKSSKIAMSSARRQHYFFEWLKFYRSADKRFSRPFFLEIEGKKFLRPFFVGKHLHLCPWSLALASSIPVLGLRFFCVLGLELVSSTPPLLTTNIFLLRFKYKKE